MNATISKQDLIPLPTYRPRRDEYITKMIAYKKNRRIKLADHLSILFENKQTVLFQIQELINSEDLTDTGEIDEYISIYSSMLPDTNELSGTLFIEMDNQTLLEELLAKLKGIEHHLSLVVGSESIPAQFEEVHDDREFTTSVHYLKFSLTQSAVDYLKNSNIAHELKLVLSHPNLPAEVSLSAEQIKSLTEDLK